MLCTVNSKTKRRVLSKAGQTSPTSGFDKSNQTGTDVEGVFNPDHDNWSGSRGLSSRLAITAKHELLNFERVD